MKLKKLIKKHGIIFFTTYIASFILLVFLNSKISIDSHIPGDIKIGQKIFFPISSSLAISVLTTTLWEAFKIFKNA
jgi:hypothetical protein